MSSQGQGGHGQGQGPGQGWKKKKFFKSKSSGKGKQDYGQTKPKRTLQDYTYYVGSAKHAADYEETTKYLINYIQRTYEYGSGVAELLNALEVYDLT